LIVNGEQGFRDWLGGGDKEVNESIAFAEKEE